MQTAMRTGRSVTDIAKESFALTLWVWGEMQKIAKEEQIQRLGERTDMAGLMAVAFHQPSDLQKAEWRYLAAAGRLTKMIDSTRARMNQMEARMQQAVDASQRTVEE